MCTWINRSSRTALALAAVWLAGCVSAGAPPSLPAAPTGAAPRSAAATTSQSIAGVVVPLRSSELSSLLEAPVRQLLLHEGDRASAGDPILVLDAPELESAVSAAEAALTSARVYAQLQRYSDRFLNDRGKWVYRTGPPELRQVADSRVLEAEAALAVAQGEFAQATIRAPFDATIALVAAREAELAVPGASLVVVADLTRFRIETTELSEREVVGLSVGQTHSAYIEALDQYFPVIVSAISPMGEAIGGDVLYTVVLDFASQPDGLLWGMTADITLAAR